MPLQGPKAESVTKDGEPDGFVPDVGFVQQHEPAMPTRLLVSVPPAFLQAVHRDLIRALSAPVGVLYRQKVDRRKPRPDGAPPRDFLRLDLDPEAVIAAFAANADLVYHDARCEIWVRGARGEQLILDQDGLLYSYPDDPALRDACRANGLEERPLSTLLDRDYVKHWFHAANDALEAALIDGLGLSEMPSQG